MEEFNYSRVDLARRRRGFTKTRLADEAKISTRSLTKYERDDQIPSDATIQRFAEALQFPVEFFYGDTLDEPPIDGTSFRSFSSLSAKQRDQALGSGALALQLSQWIDSQFKLPDPAVPTFRDRDPEAAAESVREEWGLGQRPLPNLVHLVEAHGVRVFSLAEESRAVDAFSFWHGDTPYVFLNTMTTAERSRMDCAHELGHLVLHVRGGPQGREAESEAHAFAAAFLMPASSVLARIRKGARLKDLIRQKHFWKVSVANLARRCFSLGLLSEWQYRSICIELSKRGKANEPNPMRSRETSQILGKVFKQLRSDAVSRATISQALRIPMDELDKVVFGLVLVSVDGSNEAADEKPSSRRTVNLRLA